MKNIKLIWKFIMGLITRLIVLPLAIIGFILLIPGMLVLGLAVVITRIYAFVTGDKETFNRKNKTETESSFITRNTINNAVKSYIKEEDCGCNK